MVDFETFIKRFQHKDVVEYPNKVLESVPKPRVSCWIVAYNQVNYVRQALDSVLAQIVDFPIEIVIGDDDSNDGTREVLIEYADKYPSLIRLFLHCRENNIPIHGGTPNPNFQGIYNWHYCRGEYIATLECDDFWTDPEKLAKQVRFLDANTSHMGVCTNFSVVNTDGNIIKSRKYPAIQYPDYRFQYALRFHTISRTLTCMYRNDAEVKQAMIGLAQAPFLDRIILALMTQRGPMHCLSDVMASFRSGSGFFTPHRERVGQEQLVNQWEMLTQHYLKTPFESTSVAVLHLARRKRDNKTTKKNQFGYLFRQVLPFFREPFFSFKWYLLFNYLDPVSIPLSHYAVNRKRIPKVILSRFSLSRNDNSSIESLRNDVIKMKNDLFEVNIPIKSGLLKHTLKTLPEVLFMEGYRLLDLKFGLAQVSRRSLMMVFVREGSETESMLYKQD